MSLKNEIKGILEYTFDIPFDVETQYCNEAPLLSISPAEHHGHLFSITISFQNEIRMNMNFEPQKYALQMVREMGHCSIAKKEIFCSYAKKILQLGAKTQLYINGISNNPEDHSFWPNDWEKVFIKTSVLPIEFDELDRPDYHKTTLRWIPLMMGMSLSLLRIENKDVEQEITGQLEGKKYDVLTTKYERSGINRALCLAHYGYSCQICGFNFEKVYGDVGKDFIHVHHIVPVSQLGEDYQIKPLEDLIPVCPNCHAMLHRINPPFSIEQLRNKIKE